MNTAVNVSGTREAAGAVDVTKSTTIGSPSVLKVVVNRRFGGFGLSEAAIYAYARRKGLTVYPAPIEPGHWLMNYWTVPPEERPVELVGEAWELATDEVRQASDKAYDDAMINDCDIPRDDPDLVAVVELLGPAANGKYASLDVAEIPADVKWHIHCYDGREHIAEDHRTW